MAVDPAHPDDVGLSDPARAVRAARPGPGRDRAGGPSPGRVGRPAGRANGARTPSSGPCASWAARRPDRATSGGAVAIRGRRPGRPAGGGRCRGGVRGGRRTQAGQLHLPRSGEGRRPVEAVIPPGPLVPVGLRSQPRGGGEERLFRLDRLEGPLAARGAGRRLSPGPPSRRRRPPPAWRLGDEDEVVAELLVDAEQARGPGRLSGRGRCGPLAATDRWCSKSAVTNRDAFRSFVLGFLDHAEVLGPPAAASGHGRRGWTRWPARRRRTGP